MTKLTAFGECIPFGAFLGPDVFDLVKIHTGDDFSGGNLDISWAGLDGNLEALDLDIFGFHESSGSCFDGGVIGGNLDIEDPSNVS